MRRRQVELGRTHGKAPLAPIGAEGRGKATEAVARVAGLSTRTFERAVKVIEKAPEELKERVRQGKVSIARAYEMVGREEAARAHEVDGELAADGCTPSFIPSNARALDFRAQEVCF
jgi:hypothetical protein